MKQIRRNRMPRHYRFMSMLAAIAMLIASGLPISAPAAETLTFIHTDALGSPVAATDQQGNVIWREEYKPYGERLKNEPAAQTNTRWYTGHPHDQASGLTYMGARYYDAVVGRFMGVDPAAFSEKNPHSFNRYAYGNNNPYRYIDPDGRAGVEFQPGGSVKCIAEGGCMTRGGGASGGFVQRPLPQQAPQPIPKDRALVQYDPPNNGFLVEPRKATLTKGTRGDRYGYEGGQYLSPEGTPKPMRSLNPERENLPYHRYEVSKPFEVEAGPITPAYGKPGGGEQWRTDRPISDLVRDGFLTELK